MLIHNTIIYITYFKILYSQGDMFRPSLGHPQALKENRSKTIDFLQKRNFGIPNAHIMI